MHALPTLLARSLVLSLALAGSVHGAEAPTERRSDVQGWTLNLESGGVFYSRNKARIPNDTGTRFDLLDLTGDGPEAYARVSATYDFNARHALRLTLAPLESAGTGALEAPVQFQGADFAAGVPTRGEYAFNTYRLTYRWMAHRSEQWDWGLGATLLVRDAKTALQQGVVQRAKNDVGVVPLLHLYGAWHLTERTSLVADFEGAAAPQGRAVDLALSLEHTLPSGWRLFAGYRTLEGGADNDSVYTFAWLHFAVLGLGYRF
jgi:hypothetical protein